MGAEGPADIADRFGHSLGGLSRYAHELHAANPDIRVVMWAVSHYDTISPYAKLKLLGMGLQDRLPVAYGGGFTVKIDTDGRAVAKLGGNSYPLALG